MYIEKEYRMMYYKWVFCLFYSIDGTIVILDKPPGDFIGHDLFGDVLILVGYDGAFFYNVKTLERGGVTN
jgi:hypothetical protein